MSDDRLDEKLAAGQYYDYEQHVRTLFFKLKMRKREAEYKKLIQRAMDDLLAHNQVREITTNILERFDRRYSGNLLCRACQKGVR